MSAQSNILGIYTGLVFDPGSFFAGFYKDGMNRARLTIAITDIQGAKISGEVRPEGIVKGGDFTGTYSDGSILFTTRIGRRRTITWSGSLEGNKMHGNWNEAGAGLLTQMAGWIPDHGYWECEK